MRYWYAFQSKARKERLLCEQLRIRNMEVFFPRIRIRATKAPTQRYEPYFPGYVFGHVDLDEVGQSILKWIPGAVGIVNFGGEPVSISEHLINALRQHLETINGSAREVLERFQTGDVVKIQSGPFAGYEGIFNIRLPGRDRVEVLLKLLQGSHMRLELSIGQIMPPKSKPGM